MHFVVKCLDSASQGAQEAGRGQSRHCLQVSLCTESPPLRHQGQLFGNADTGRAFSSFLWNTGEVEVLVTSLPLEVIPKGEERKVGSQDHTHNRSN